METKMISRAGFKGKKTQLQRYHKQRHSPLCDAIKASIAFWDGIGALDTPFPCDRCAFKEPPHREEILLIAFLNLKQM